VTHQPALLSHCDNIILLDRGTVQEEGVPSELLKKRYTYSPFKAIMETVKVQPYNDSTLAEKHTLDGELSEISIADKGPVSLKEEERAVGNVDRQLYRFYGRHAGGKGFLITLLVMFLTSVMIRSCSSLWISWWMKDEFELEQNLYMIGYVSLIVCQAATIGAPHSTKIFSPLWDQK
jgi:hypothetical protein